MGKANLAGWRRVLLLLAACLCAACEAEQPQPPGAALEATLAELEGQPSSLHAARLRAQLSAGLAYMDGRPIGAEEVRLAVVLGRAALRLQASGIGAGEVAATRRLLDRVARDAGLPGLCEALVVRARLARAAGPDARADQRRLAEAQRRFAGQRAARACLDEIAALRAAWSKPRAEGGQVAAVQQRSTLLGVEVFGQPDEPESDTRIVLYLDRAAPFRRSERPAAGDAPRAVLLTLDGADVTPALPRHIAVGRGGVQSMVIEDVEPLGGAQAGGGVRVAFRVAPEAQYRMFSLPSPYRLVFDFKARARQARAAGQLRVVLDPGHGGRNPGAKGPTGLRESDVALSLARRVRRALRRDIPGVRVVLTRDADREVSLEERVAIANGFDADLFVSLHLNASASPEDRGGVSTFILDTTDDSQAVRLAARENGTEEAAVTELQMVLASLYREGQVERSRRAARAVHGATLRAGRGVLPELPDRGVKSALFHVLVGAAMPAILVEASFITRPDEEAALRTDAYRTALAEGIAQGIRGYFSRPGGVLARAAE